jgi:hypothetical protein
MRSDLKTIVLTLGICYGTFSIAAELQIATFAIDVTPPMGSPLCAGSVKPAATVDNPLSARGVALLPEGQAPIVLCAVDYTGISNGAHDAWREALASAAGTTIDRVAVHTLHQHDAPWVDFTSEDLLAPLGLGGKCFDVAYAKDSIARCAAALKLAIEKPTSITTIGAGSAEVYHVASNRRLIGADGKSWAVRWTTTTDPHARAEPEGTIDPMVRVVAFWNNDIPVAALTYYATHPQCNYGEGHVSHDFVGMARETLERTMPGVRAIHFNGAGGNITAGKYNDGAPGNRALIANRLFDGVKRAWDTQTKTPVTDLAVSWRTVDTALPLRDEIDDAKERATLNDANAAEGARIRAAHELAWRDRANAGKKISVAALHLGPAIIVHLPGELFIEYQLAAQSAGSQATVCTAAYGDGGPGYIGTAIAYPQGGYETELYVSRTSPRVEAVLIEALNSLLK